MIARKILLSPLVHFFALGGLIFAIFAMVNDDPDPAPDTVDFITLSPSDAERLVEQFSSTWNRSPTAEELSGLMQSWALEEAFVREALSLGLDCGDAVVRQRLRMKMQFLAEAGAATGGVDDAVLQTYLEENEERFVQPQQFSFDQILLPTPTSEAVERSLARLADGADATTLGQPTLLPASMPLTAAPLIDRTFGSGFGASLGGLPVGEWAGPVESGYGLHLVRVSGMTDGRLPPLADIRDRVEAEWRAADARRMRESFGDALLERYTVNLPDADRVLQQ